MNFWPYCIPCFVNDFYRKKFGWSFYERHISYFSKFIHLVRIKWRLYVVFAGLKMCLSSLLVPIYGQEIRLFSNFTVCLCFHYKLCMVFIDIMVMSEIQRVSCVFIFCISTLHVTIVWYCSRLSWEKIHLLMFELNLIFHPIFYLISNLWPNFTFSTFSGLFRLCLSLLQTYICLNVWITLSSALLLFFLNIFPCIMARYILVFTIIVVNHCGKVF